MMSTGGSPRTFMKPFVGQTASSPPRNISAAFQIRSKCGITRTLRLDDDVAGDRYFKGGGAEGSRHEAMHVAQRRPHRVLRLVRVEE